MTWQQQYKKEQLNRFYDSTFSRVRGRTSAPIYIVIRNRGFAKSDIFEICKFCGGLKIMGLCQKCSMVRVCSWCDGIIQPNRTTLKTLYVPRNNVTHGLCGTCETEQMEEIYG